MIIPLLISMMLATRAFSFATHSLLPSAVALQRAGGAGRHFASVSGMVYGEDSSSPRVRLFTKEGCTLCDKVKDVLESVREEYPHSLEQVDITDGDKRTWFDKYKYDIPVLHLNNKYWVKHRLSAGEVEQAFKALSSGTFESPQGEPNAGEMER